MRRSIRKSDGHLEEASRRRRGDGFLTDGALAEKGEQSKLEDRTSTVDRCGGSTRAADLGGESACWAHLVDQLDGAEGW